MKNDFFQHLKMEHAEVKQILEQLDATTSKAAKTREKLLEKLDQKLLPHMIAEEEVFYSTLQHNKESTEDVLEALEEHHAAKNVLDELHNLPYEKENWGAKLRVFKEMIEHHIKEEEHTIFDDARKALNNGQIEEIFTRFKQSEDLHLHAVV